MQFDVTTTVSVLCTEITTKQCYIRRPVGLNDQLVHLQKNVCVLYIL